MLAPGQYRRKYSKTSMKEVEGRRELYDKHGQHISITYNPTMGQKLPLLVKFPHLSSYFRLMPQNSIYRQHCEGLFNGVYYIPREFEDARLPTNNCQPLHKYGYNAFGNHLSILRNVKESQSYKVLRSAYRDVPKNVSVTTQGTVRIKSESKQTNFRQSDELKDAGNYS